MPRRRLNIKRSLDDPGTGCSRSIYEDPANLVAVNKKFAGYTFYPTSAEDMSLLYRLHSKGIKYQ